MSGKGGGGMKKFVGKTVVWKVRDGSEMKNWRDWLMDGR